VTSSPRSCKGLPLLLRVTPSSPLLGKRFKEAFLFFGYSKFCNVINSKKNMTWTKMGLLTLIATELRRHALLTTLGAFTGGIIIAIIVFFNVPARVSENIFYTVHPLHVGLSAFATTAMYARYKGKISGAVLVGYVGSIGLDTISDAIIPYLVGGDLFNIEMEFHIPFMEKWWLINFMAFIGIALGYLTRITAFPHAGHALLSALPPLFYLTAFGVADWVPLLPYIFLFLFLVIWVHCWFSDIVFPLLFL